MSRKRGTAARPLICTTKLLLRAHMQVFVSFISLCVLMHSLPPQTPPGDAAAIWSGH